MKIALTVWEDRISPVFDSAHLLLVAEIENGKVINRDYQTFNPEMPSHLVDVLTELNVSILICGAVSEIPASIISSDNIQLIPFISGNTDKVLEAYVQGFSIVPEFSMPGCGVNRFRKGRKRQINLMNFDSDSQKEVSSMPNKDGKGPAKGGCGAAKGGRGKGTGKNNARGGGQRGTCGKGAGNKSAGQFKRK
jgi:predicted Fe-Mo cluster-binding NifX family protein